MSGLFPLAVLAGLLAAGGAAFAGGGDGIVAPDGDGADALISAVGAGSAEGDSAVGARAVDVIAAVGAGASGVASGVVLSDDASDGGIDVAVADGGDGVAGGDGGAGMPRVFFTPMERRVLEAARLGLLTFEPLESEAEADLYVYEGGVVDHPPAPRRRAMDLRIGSLIRNRQDGRVILWINDEMFDVRADAARLSALGLTIDSVSAESPDAMPLIRGYDDIADDYFEARVGQIIAADGAITDSPKLIFQQAAGL